MNSVSVIHHPHPILPALAQEFREHAWRSGETVRELLIRQGLDMHKEIVVVLNDRLLTVAEWDEICPQPSDILNVQAVVSGGGGKDGGGSNALQVVLMIVVMVVAWYVAPELGAFMGGFGEGATASTVGNFGLTLGQWTGISAAAVMMAGNMVLGAVFKPSGKALSSANGLEAASANTPNYSLSGGSNSIRPYEPMPVVMGRHRIFPDYGAKPYTEFQGEDQYLYQVFNFGTSALALTDFKIGETSLWNYSGVSTYWGDANGRIGGFPGNVDSDAGAQLIRGAGWVQRTTSPETIQIAVDIEGAVYYQGDRGLVSCAATIEAYYAPTGTGAWVPMAAHTVVSYSTGYWSLQTVETIYEYSEFSSYSYQKITQQAAASDGHYEGETQIVREAFDSAEYVDYSYSTTHHPAIYGTWHWVDFGTADRNYWPHPDPVPSYSTAYNLDISHGASQKSQRNTLRVGVASGQYDVIVRLTSARSELGEIGEGDNRGGYQYSFSVLKSYQQDTANYAGQTRFGMVIKASGQLNGVVQKLSAMAEAYCNVWDGSSWRWMPTSNPAWWFLDFALGRKNAYGVKLYGCHLGWENIDVASLKLWAQFCDAEGLSCNMILDRNQSAWDTLTTIARCGMASVSYSSGTLGVIWDRKNASPVAAFGMSNIIKGSFSVQYVTENLADEIVVSFVDEARDWQQQQVRTLSPGITSPTRTSTVELMGCTNAAMAGKFANYLAAQQVYRKRMITWESDFEGFTCQRGDVVILSHDLTQWGYSGRFVNVAGATLTLERPVPRSGVAEYLMVAFPDGTLTTYTVTAGTGDQDVITLTAPLVLQDGYGPVDHRWFFSPLPTPGKKVKIVSVRPVSQSRVAIVATDEDANFYDAWNGYWTQPPQQTLLRNPIPSITQIGISETLALINLGVVGSRITLTFNVDNPFDKISVRYRIARGPWTSVSTIASPMVIDTEETGLMEIEANAVNGLFMGPRFNASALIFGKTLPPANVQNFGLSITGGQAYLTFDPPTDIDVQVGGLLRVRHASAVNGAKWENSSRLLDVAAPSSHFMAPLMTGTYLAKWVDSPGNESKDAALVVNEISSGLLSMNVVDTLNDGASWPGSMSGVMNDPSMGGIKLTSVALIDELVDNVDDWMPIDTIGGIVDDGSYTLLDSIDLGQVATSRLSASLDFITFSATDLIDGWGMIDSKSDIDAGGDPLDNRLDGIDAWPDIDGVDLSAVNVFFEVSTSLDNVTWSAWHPFVAGENTFRAVRARIRLQSKITHINVVVRSASILVDMPDRTESGNDISAPAAVLSVVFSTRFMTMPALAIAGQGMATGDYFTITNKTLAGFDIVFKNAAGSPVARTFDWIAKGY